MLPDDDKVSSQTPFDPQDSYVQVWKQQTESSKPRGQPHEVVMTDDDTKHENEVLI